MRYDRVRLALLALLLAACGEGSQVPGGPAGPEEPGPAPAPVPGVVASAPVARTLLGQPGSETVAFVAAPSGTVARGRGAAVVNRRTGARVDAVVEEGGFDPVALVADDGDVVEVTLTDSGGHVTTTPLAVKRGTRPRVVRTAPEPRATDVPLNSVIRVVFTTPVRASAAAGAIRLFSNGVAVEGAIRMNGDADVVVDFEPAARLAANADYELQVDAGLRDVLGEVLETAVAVPFTTGTTIAAATAVGIQVGRFGAIPRFTLALGDSVELVAYAYAGRRIPIRQEIRWASSPETVLRLRVAPASSSAPSGSRAILLGVGGGAVVVRASAGVVTGGLGLFVRDQSFVVPAVGRLMVARATGLFAVDADGGNAVQLTTEGTEPAVAPDGRIAYVRSDGSIRVFGGSGWAASFERPAFGTLLCPAFSPDGERLAYVRGQGTGTFDERYWYELVVVSSTVSVTVVPLFLAGESPPPCGYWSPDGLSLAFTLGSDAWIVDLQFDGTSSPRVSPSRRLVAGWSAGPFSPDGLRMAGLRAWKGGGVELGFVSLADGSVDLGDRFFWQQDSRRLYEYHTGPLPLGSNGWSADGRWFVFDLSREYGVGVAQPGRGGVHLLFEGSFPAVLPSVASGTAGGR